MVFVTVALFVVAVGSGLLAWRLWHEERRRSNARVEALSSAVDGPAPVSGDAGLASFLDTERRSPVQGRPLTKAAIGLAAAVTVTVLIAMTSTRHDSPAGGPSPASLELLSMSHSRDGQSLTVTGLVRNSSRAAAHGVDAVVFAFDRNGTFVASGRTRLDDGILAPGDESAFQVLIPSVRDVGRYRVSFRVEAGVIRHLDRRRGSRAPGSLAALRASS